MHTGFNALGQLLKSPISLDGGIKTDNSVLLIYPPERELDFRQHLLDTFLPQLDVQDHPYRTLNLTGFLFADLDEATIVDLCEDEFDDYRWLRQGIASRIEHALPARIAVLAAEIPGGTIFVFATVALYPFVRFGELLRDLRDLPVRVVLAFPGEERGGKLHFMKQPDGGNYLAANVIF